MEEKDIREAFLYWFDCLGLVIETQAVSEHLEKIKHDYFETTLGKMVSQVCRMQLEMVPKLDAMKDLLNDAEEKLKKVVLTDYQSKKPYLTGLKKWDLPNNMADFFYELYDSYHDFLDKGKDYAFESFVKAIGSFHPYDES